ncbi:hypothetical protein BH11MYX4_BH11MYX4_08260 [soil metagenome]
MWLPTQHGASQRRSSATCGIRRAIQRMDRDATGATWTTRRPGDAGLSERTQRLRRPADAVGMTTVTEWQRKRPIEPSATHEATSPSAPRAASPSPSRGAEAHDARMTEAIDRLPVSADMSDFYARLGGAAGSPTQTPRDLQSARAALVNPTLGSARDTAVRARLDAFCARFSGPYDVAGQTVTAPPMFRMNHPTFGNAASLKQHAGELSTICARARIGTALGPAWVGRCTPEQLVKVTQALIDAGKLPPADAAHTTLADRIRGMQWEWGIGVDCAGYTQQAAAAVHGAAGAVFMSNVMGDVFSGMMQDKRFQSVMIADIRAGDVMHLDAPVRGAVGHNVICHSHATLDQAGIQKALSHPLLEPEARAFLNGKGPFHTFEVESSWGAGEHGSMVGGFRRDTWIYDESTFTWASFPAGQRALPLQVHADSGPQGEFFGGAFRPKEQP